MTTYGSGAGSYYGGFFSSMGSSMAFGLRGKSISTSLGMGLMGDASQGTKAIGVWGSASSVNTGAAIYGTVNGDLGSALTTGNVYAGFFNGDVKITSNLVVNGSVEGMVLSESIDETNGVLRSRPIKTSTIRNNLSNLTVSSFQKKTAAPTCSEDDLTIFKLDGDSTKVVKKTNIIDKQYYDKTHYALNADQLEEYFPDLVYKKEDGCRVINYLEMIPLLVQSINELNAEIEALKSYGGYNESRGLIATAMRTDAISNHNILYSNKPNPFKGTCIIQFKLSDDVKDAAICFFNMNGSMLKKIPVSPDMSSISVSSYELGEGVFLYSLIVNGHEIDTKRMIITK